MGTSDGRRNEIKITEAGREIAENSEKHFRLIDEMLFDGFSDGELALYQSFLDRMQKNVIKILDRKEREK